MIISFSSNERKTFSNDFIKVRNLFFVTKVGFVFSELMSVGILCN